MKVFFKGLNELRAIASLLVVLHHVELYKHRDEIPSMFDTGLELLITNLGKNGVFLFFVLSGFLISYILLTEQKETSKINLRRFWKRRILRIWPLYYLVIFLSFYLIPEFFIDVPFLQKETTYLARIRELSINNFFEVLTLYLLVLPNVALIMFQPVVGAAQAWSVGVEEQFYLIWPLAIKFVKRKKYVLIFLICIIVGRLIFDRILWYLEFPYKGLLVRFFYYFRIELMAIGGLGAYFYIYSYKLIKLIFSNKIFLLGTYLFTLFVLFFYQNSILLGFLFLTIILSAVTENPWSIKFRLFNNLGKISYGIYMFHPIVMFLVFGIVNTSFNELDLIYYNSIVYSGTLILTIVLAYISFQFFEKKFLNLKERF